MLFSKGSSPPRDKTWVSCIAGRLFTISATREAHKCQKQDSNPRQSRSRSMQETPVRFLGGKGPLEKGQATHSWSEYSWAFLVAQMVKNSPAIWKTWVHPGVGKIPWRTAWQPTPVFLPGESPWAEEPGGYSPGGHEELDTTERLSTAQDILLSPVLSSS